MRKLSSLLLIALLAITSVGCDSNDDESDADKFVGTWALTGVSDDAGDASEAFGAMFSSVTLTNNANGSFVLNVVPRAGEPLAIPGTYTVSESNSRFTLSASLGTTTASLVFTYDFNGDDSVDLTTVGSTAVLLNTLFGTTLEGEAVITVTRQ